MLGVTMQNLVAWVTCHLGFRHHSHVTSLNQLSGVYRHTKQTLQQ